MPADPQHEPTDPLALLDDAVRVSQGTDDIIAAAAWAVAEITRLRRGWLRVIQQENSCPATGGGCFAKRCGCLAEMEMLANE